MRRTYAAAVVVLVGGAVGFVAGGEPAAAPPPAAPSTAPTVRVAADTWVGEFSQFGGYQPRKQGADGGGRRVSIARDGDHYRLRGTMYDQYEFVEDKPGLLWDRKRILGTISRGTLTFDQPGRVGAKPPATVLHAEFCYDSFYLFSDLGPAIAAPAAPEAATAAPGAGRGEVRQFGKPEAVNVEGQAGPLGLGAVAFSPDGRTVLTANRRRVWLWDAATGREVRRWDAGPADDKNPDKVMLRSAVFSPDGRQVLAFGLGHEGQRLGGWMALWDVKTGEVVRRFDGQPSSTSAAAFSPDGKRIAAGGGNGFEHDSSLWLWDATTGERIRAFPGIPDVSPVEAVAFTPDGKRILAGGDRVRVYDADAGRLVGEWPHGAYDVRVSADGARALSTQHSGVAWLWDLETLKPIQELKWTPGTDLDRPGSTEGADLRDVAFVPGGDRAVTASFKGPMVWDLKTGKMLRRIQGHSRYVNRVAVSPDGRYVVTGGEDGTARMWAVESKDEG